MGGGLTPRRAGRLGDGVPGKPWKAMVVFDVFSHEVTKSGVFFSVKEVSVEAIQRDQIWEWKVSWKNGNDGNNME